MAAPTYSWTYQPDAGLDPISPVAATTWRDFNRNAIHCRELAYDPAAHVPIVAHDHDGANSAMVYPPSGQLIISSKWGRSRNDMDEQPVDDNITFPEDSQGLGGGRMESSGDYVAVRIAKADVGKGLLGAAAKVVVSVYVRAIQPTTTGALRFGLSDEHTSTFKTGCRAEITSAMLTSAWQRFWTVCTTGSAFTGDPWALFRVTTGFDAELRIDCPMATLGTSLAWWWVIQHDTSVSSSGGDYRLLDCSRKMPFFDSRIAMSKAVKLTAV